MRVTPSDSHAAVTAESVNRRLPAGVDQLPSGAFRARVAGPDGKQMSLGSFPNATAAGRAASHARAEIGRGQWLDPRRSTITLDPWMDMWWPHRDVRPYTLEKDRQLYARLIKPYLGGMQLVKITPFQVQRWMTRLAEDGKRAASIKKAHTLLKTALGVRGAIGDHRLAVNPCRTARPPAVTRKDWKLLTRAEFDRIHTAAGEQWRPLLLVAAFAGLRWSEIAALQRSDFNPLGATLSVTKSIDSKGRVQPTKSRRHRIVPLAPHVVVALNAHIETWAPVGPLFTSPTGARLSATNFAARVWRPACKKAKVQARFHDLRHSCASWLLAGGATTAEVRDMLGHSSITVTEVYLHTDPTTLAATVTRAFA